MSIHRIPKVPAEQENHRFVDLMTGAPAEPGKTRFITSTVDPVEPLPVGSYVAMVFRVTGYDPDCDGSLMVRAEQVDRNGEPSGWEIDSIGLYEDYDVLLDGPGDLHDLIEPDA